MKRFIGLAIATGALGLAGCGKQASSTAPPKPETQTSNDRGENRKLTVKAPIDQHVTQDQTSEFSVSVSRSNFADPVTIEIATLPKGVEVVTKDMTIPAGKDSLRVSVKAAPDAPPVENHVVKVTAKANDMPVVTTDFKMGVKPKK